MCSFQWQSSVYLKLFNDAAFTTWIGSPFQMSVTLFEKKCCLSPVFTLHFLNLYICPLFLVSSFLIRGELTSYISWVNFKTSIISPLFLLYCMLGRHRLSNLFSYANSAKPGTNLEALLNTVSIRFLSFWNLGDHATLLNSRWGLTSAVNNNLRLSLSKNWYDLLISPKILFALATCASTCLLNLSSLSTITPRSFSHCEVSSFALSCE